MFIKCCGAYCSLVLNLLKLVSANKRCDYSLKIVVTIKEIVIQWQKPASFSGCYILCLLTFAAMPMSIPINNSTKTNINYKSMTSGPMINSEMTEELFFACVLG